MRYVLPTLRRVLPIGLALLCAVSLTICELTANADLNRHGSLFAERGLPVAPGMRQELYDMRKNGRLTDENERTIDKYVRFTAREVHMPPAILWCLMFQESRLNHMLGLEATSGATGIGQFLFPSFYEVNFHLDRYTEDNERMFLGALDRKDVRPIGAFRADPTSHSSYYYLPTAIAATAAYLNNRYHQLKRPLENAGIQYNSDLLWLQSAMAYNKGGRSVMLLWRELRTRLGQKKFAQLMADPTKFLETVENEELMQTVLSKVWAGPNSIAFAKEWRTHVRKLADCSIATPSYRQAKGRGLAGEK